MHGVHKNAQAILSRIRRIQGQLRGVEKMITEDVYCIDIITQTSAAKQALSSLEDIMIESHMLHCLARDSYAREQKTVQELTNEIIKVFKLKRR